ncbi:hypothetical protein L873DRAFT_1830718 [Choiromyces venosus 120613-1]|uniref:Peptidase M24 domain-containing protein n=1 Tax=Choiromyces venosus 120613-1 TaxID=1336337 RepID=A0A3N4J5B8_9PEZI|nr:hypothetical protein L873DRAFT_1830718 [Choiromyces venosus 120613-1]
MVENSWSKTESRILLAVKEDIIQMYRKPKEKADGAAAAESNPENNFTLSLTKCNEAAALTPRVFAKVYLLAIQGDGKTILSLCKEGDKFWEEECSKVFKGKKISKGIVFPMAVAANDILTPYTPLATDPSENEIAIRRGDVLKTQLCAKLGGYPAIVGDTVIVGQDAALTDDQKILLIAIHSCNEALLHLLPSEIHPLSTPEKPLKKPSAYGITQILNKITAACHCTSVKSITAFKFSKMRLSERSASSYIRWRHLGCGIGSQPEFWETQGSFRKKTYIAQEKETKAGLKRRTPRTTFTEVNKQFGNFPFGPLQLEDERTAKMGIVECIHCGVKVRSITSRLFTTIAKPLTLITSENIKIASPLEVELEKLKIEKSRENAEILE